MSRRTLLSLVRLSLAAFCFSMAAMAQDTTYGKWVTDPNNLATAAFVYAPPPNGFNPLTASATELEQFGLPPRPTRSEAERYARWKRMVTATRMKPELKPTGIYNGLPRDRRIVSSTDSSITSTSENWSGYAFVVADDTFAANNSEVYAEWIVPAVQQAPGICTSTPDYSAQWVGFDGDSVSTDVLQAGTEADVVCTHREPDPSYYAWFEWYPALGVQVSNFPVSAGNGMQVAVWYTTASPQGHTLLLNQTTNESALIGFTEPSGATYLGNSAEWIMERPMVGGALPNLPNFGFFGFNDGFAVNNSGVSYTPGARLRGVTEEQITMVYPPWNPTTTCNGRRGPTDISTFNLNVGNEGDNTMWFTADPPAGAQ